MVPWEGGWAEPLGVEPRLEQEIWLWSGSTTHWRNNIPPGLGTSNKAVYLFIWNLAFKSRSSELQSSLLIVLIGVVSTHTLEPVCTFPTGSQCNLTWNVHGFQQRLVLRAGAAPEALRLQLASQILNENSHLR